MKSELSDPSYLDNDIGSIPTTPDPWTSIEMTAMIDDESPDNLTFNVSNIFNEVDRVEVMLNSIYFHVFMILAYTFVFSCCFFGNLVVIVVIIMHHRMRTVTNFFLANLAFADLCVGIFCVYQNLSLYLLKEWTFGDFMCKMYHFVHALSYTSSILILTVICIERYMAIMYPIWSRKTLTMKRLRVSILCVWICSAGYSSPKIIMYGARAVANVALGQKPYYLCVLRRNEYDSKTYDIIHFVMCFVLPLLVMTVLYTIICVRLWKSGVPNSSDESRYNRTARARNVSRGDKSAPEQSLTSTDKSGDINEADTGTNIDDISWTSADEEQSEQAGNYNEDSSKRKSSSVRLKNMRRNLPVPESSGFQVTNPSQSPNVKVSSSHRKEQSLRYTNTPMKIARGRRKIIRLLVVVVLAFAACNLPFHARKMWQYWSPHYSGSSKFSVLFTIATMLTMYMNSGINPFLYAFFSENFRKCVVEVCLCKHHRNPRDKSIKSRSTCKSKLGPTISGGSRQ